MAMNISKADAKRIRQKLMSAPVAPGEYAHFINAGTEKILTILEENYFQEELPEGISCFKYLEGDYGSGKTQFIHSLAERGRRNHIVTAIVNIGQECPFKSPLAIFRAIVSSFMPPIGKYSGHEGKGIEVLLKSWAIDKLKELGWSTGQEIPVLARRQVEQAFNKVWYGAPDTQMASALLALGKRILDLESGAQPSNTDTELFSWVRGENVKSKNLKELYSLHEPTRDETAFKRLKTVIEFLRNRLGFKGFFIAFDEGTRTESFRRGSVARHQAIENMLTMINENAEGEFGGVMFLYAATPTFRSEVIQNYQALDDRIGSVAFFPGRPMTPLIVLESLNSEKITAQIGEKLLAIFSKADGVEWDLKIQSANIQAIIQALKNVKYFETDRVPPRHFVFQFCSLLDQQKNNQTELTIEQAENFVQTHELPETEDDE
ncbi:MAG: ATP-binding protein [Proteobacteria bacterium]|nr:ATP-binding protein [Pseudomonadota bacterium]MBU1648357.1 ATP-binding protein [Pseudomonadota bacterium]